MKEEDIKQKDSPVLREKARLVKPEELSTEYIQRVIADMKSALHDTDDGVAIAAPQIGESLRIFIIRGNAFAERDDISDNDKVFINPEIINTSKKTEILDEGCLSVRNVYGKIERSKQATVRAIDVNGDEFEMGGSGLIAQIFQHETDHLNGVLFIDHADDLREIQPNQISHNEPE